MSIHGYTATSMISLIHRFHGHNSLRGVYQKGKSVYSANLKALYISSKGKSYRAAVVVSKKVHKSAVVRNRIRRRVYEQVRLCMASEPKNVDIVLLAQNEKLAHMTPDELQNEVVGLLKKTVGVL